MSSQISSLAVLYIAVPATTAQRWLAQGLSADNASSPDKADCVQAWPTLCPPPEPIADPAWLVASVAADAVSAADWDLGAAMRGATPAEQDTLRAAFEASIMPFAAYRLGQYRRPVALVQTGIPADRLALIPSSTESGCRDNEQAYARQLRQLLRAMIGAPAAAPLGALLAAAIARGRATPVATVQDAGRALRLYRLDSGSAYFAYDSTLAALEDGDTATPAR
ncbi:MAG: hypothetical protein U0641_07840 [Anaerolineae bacterium]